MRHGLPSCMGTALRMLICTASGGTLGVEIPCPRGSAAASRARAETIRAASAGSRVSSPGAHQGSAAGERSRRSVPPSGRAALPGSGARRPARRRGACSERGRGRGRRGPRNAARHGWPSRAPPGPVRRAVSSCLRSPRPRAHLARPLPTEEVRTRSYSSSMAYDDAAAAPFSAPPGSTSEHRPR